MNTNSVLKAGQSRPFRTLSVRVKPNLMSISRVASIATTALMVKYSNILSVTREELKSFHEVSLTAVVMRAINSEQRLDNRLVVPSYFDSMLVGLDTKIGRNLVTAVLEGELSVTIPESYQEVAMQLRALGVSLNKVRNLLTRESSTLQLSIETIDGSDIIIGNLRDIDVDTLVRRGLLTVTDQSMILALTGELGLQYGELDILTQEYFFSAISVSS